MQHPQLSQYTGLKTEFENLTNNSHHATTLRSHVSTGHQHIGGRSKVGGRAEQLLPMSGYGARELNCGDGVKL